VATTIALYLPQFHPIPENDAWYGAGFTEWHNVVRAKPLFSGHYQPHLPRDFGFYDLRVREVREAQARAAKAHGIDAYCYYHYWFEGQRPLRHVVDEAIEHGVPEIPFCLAWANENWSRSWDAAEYEVLLRQRYSAEDDEAHGLFLLSAMSSPNYLRVQGRPVLFIYRLQAMPEASRTLERWRELWRAGGIGEVEVIKFDTHGDFNDPARYGADAAAQFLPHGLAEQEPPLADVDAAEGNLIYDYEDAMRLYLAASQPAWRRYECVVPMWDNTSRRGDGRSLLLHNSTPALYEEWLHAVAERAGPDGLVLINAWNEWAEGAHLEPDLEHGDGYLKATARALTGSSPAQPSAPPPLSAVPFELRDRFAELYLDGLETQTVLQRRLSRLEATLDRQLSSASEKAEAELTTVRAHADSLSRENERLRRELQLAGGASPNGAAVG
jgi:hypothetical protein